MKKLNIFLFLSFVFFIGCSKNNFKTGVKGTVKYGQGDCMPQVIQEDNNYGNHEKYENYKGNMYFILKKDLDNLGNGDFDQLKNKSITVSVNKGKLSTELPIGTYLAMPDGLYMYSEHNTITIKPGEVLNKNLSFWKCTSY